MARSSAPCGASTVEEAGRVDLPEDIHRVPVDAVVGGEEVTRPVGEPLVLEQLLVVGDHRSLSRSGHLRQRRAARRERTHIPAGAADLRNCSTSIRPS